MANHREQLLRIGHEILDPVHPQPGRIRVHILKGGGAEFRLLEESTEMEATMSTTGGSPSRGIPMPEGWPSWWKPFSEAEERLLRVASTEHWQSASTLAEKARVRAGNDLLPILRGLVDKGMLESSTGKGFRLKAPPEGQSLPAFCGAGLLAEQINEV
jgi:hypothetical protein